ncbi:major facilitator superfamily domain-containing protein [Durotheca rogersii]|uniref:major facilitator superfamily domain-containing protein n=1 Tax=Durotheca rogersii TaxID=419775 RepID=UPI002220006D|nr:major facilitator superfamily domain-containing protein [Durotheca rogersii]KAI5861659.1 major facilitator superfamily domain-containing protein [Durotheca rogersii]
MLLFYLMWPKPHHLPAIERRSWKELDYFGSILLISFAVLIVYAFQSVGIDSDRWSQAVFIAPLAVGVVSAIGLLLWSLFVERQWGDAMAAALPMNLLRDRVYTSAALNTMFLGFPYILIIYAFPLRLQVVNGKDPLISGVFLLPMLACTAIGSALSGFINGEKDRAFASLLAANSLMIIGCGLLSTLSASYEIEARALGFLVFIGLGFGMVVSTATMLSSLRSSIRDHAPAQGIMAQVRVLGGSIGIAASSVILSVTLGDEVGVVNSSQLALLESDHSREAEMQLTAIRGRYSDAFNTDMRVCTIVASVAILFTFGTFTRNRLTVAERRELQKLNEAARREATASD